MLIVELIGLYDLRADGKTIPRVVEDGKSPLENARLKATAYYEAFHIPVFPCGSGLYFDNVQEGIQPGVHVRNVNGKCLTDDEMIDYYFGLVKIYGKLVARYRNAICFVQDDTIALLIVINKVSPNPILFEENKFWKFINLKLLILR